MSLFGTRRFNYYLQLLERTLMFRKTNTLFAALAVALIASPVLADNNNAPRTYSNERTYEVTITNVSATTFTPLLVALHTAKVSLFSAGDAASDELALLAEGGATQPFLDLLDTLPRLVGDADSTVGLLAPGASVTSIVTANRKFNRVSIAAMLLPTNDSFVGLSTVRVPFRIGVPVSYTAIGYDAGSEPNDELCANIPGPQCGGEGPSPDADGEGFIRVSPGIHGEGDLDASDYDWRNPVARVTITRVQSSR